MASGIAGGSVASPPTAADFPRIPTDLVAGYRQWTMWLITANLPGMNSTGPDRLMLQADLTTADRRRVAAHLDWGVNIPVGAPLCCDVRGQEGAGVQFAVVTQGSTTLALHGPGYMLLDGTVADGSGFLLEDTDKTRLMAAWNAAGTVTHDRSNEGSLAAPPGFDGWAGNSATWPMAFGQGRSAAFTQVLGTLPAVGTWFDPRDNP